VEKRKSLRFSLHAPTIFRWTNQRGKQKQSAGYTRDISTSGIFVISSARLLVGTAVSLEVYLPALEKDSSQRLRLEARGKIIRLAETSEGRGFAAAYKQTLLHQV
jgi:PilZ domain